MTRRLLGFVDIKSVGVVSGGISKEGSRTEDVAVVACVELECTEFIAASLPKLSRDVTASDENEPSDVLLVTNGV